MDEQRQDDKLEPIYSSSVPIQDIALKTSREQWTIVAGGERGPGRSVLVARHDDDDIKAKIRNRIASIDYVVIKTKPLIIKLVNVANLRERSIGLATTGWER